MVKLSDRQQLHQSGKRMRVTTFNMATSGLVTVYGPRDFIWARTDGATFDAD